MDLNHIFRSGKYAGYTVNEVYARDRRYINWVLENRPEMLKSHKKKAVQQTYTKPTYVDPPEVSDKPSSGIKPVSPEDAFGL